MKNLIYVCLIAIAMTACQEDKKTSSNEMKEENAEEQMKAKEREQNFEIEKEEDKTVEEAVNIESETVKSKNDRPGPATQWSGEFIKSNALNTNGACNCNCLDIGFNAARTLCIDEKAGIDIQVNYVIKENHVEVIYLDGQGNIEEKNPIPWSDFDKNSVIAEISMINNQLQLDWKGFTIDNKLATNYAILGKKNLEGNYKRK